ncbi:MAG: hypothetical protein IBX49_06965 [Gammaproteobacteria bacterium]|nr:hypothetical protein [Gammaproteobacteria bacterium]
MGTKPASRGLSLLLGTIIGMVLLIPQQASAVPAFARQVGMSCVACHNQAFPALNAFGRSFRAGGYTMVGGKSLIEGDDISLPMAMNLSAVLKARYVKENGDSGEGVDHGQIQFPDEAALLIGGRMAKDVGFLFEVGMAGIAGGVEGENDPITNEVTGEAESIALLGAKMHFNVANVGASQLSVIPFTTDALGVGYGFELLNTGVQRSQRAAEPRTSTSAGQALGTGAGAATGMAFVASSHRYFVNYTAWTPGFWGENQDIKPAGLAHALRAVYMPNLGGWDTGFGMQYMTGDVKVAGEAPMKTDAWLLDAQALGQVASMPLSLYASYGRSKGDPDSIWNTNDEDASAWSVMAQLGVKPNKANVYLAYRAMDDGAAADSQFNALAFGGQYLWSQNIRFELFHVMESGSGVDARANGNDSQTMLQLFAGF